jgi:xylulokinase
MSLEDLTELAASCAAGSNGLLFLPYLRGERVPDLPHAQGALLGVVPGALSPGAFFRAAMEGATLALASGVERMKSLGISVDAVRVVGGGSKSALWRQVLADCLEVPIVGLWEEESAAFGAALQAVWISRRVAGERVSADDVASTYVKLDGTVTDPSANVGVYREGRVRLEEQTRKLFG